MTTKFAVFAVLLGLVAPPLAATAEDIPDALAVEWQGKKICENLYEDAQIRVLRCTIPSSAVHVKHSHPPSFGYVLSGGKVQVTDAKGTRSDESKTDEYPAALTRKLDQHPPPWRRSWVSSAAAVKAATTGTWGNLGLLLLDRLALG